MKKIKFKMGLTSAVITVVVLICVLLLNSIVGLVGDSVPLTIDLTRDKVYEFSAQTKEIMKNLDDEVYAYVLLPEGTENEYVDYIKMYLDKYKMLSDNFKVEYVDPYDNPAFMSNYNDGENQAGIGSVIIECDDDFKVITFEQLYSQSSLTNAVQIDMERKVTNAVMSVTGSLGNANIYFINGHGEYYVQNLSSLFTDEGYVCKEINLSANEIPDDATILFSVVPTADLTQEERDALDAFLDKGGKFVLVTSPGMQPMERLDGYLNEWGLALNYDYVIETDENSSLASGSSVPIPAAKLEEHAITQKILDAKSPLALPDAMSISVSNSKNDAFVTKLLMTSEKAFGKKDLNDTELVKKDGDLEGPLCMAAISEKMGDSSSAVMVIGSISAVEIGQLVNESAFLNGDFMLNAISYISGGTDSGSIRAKQISPEIMTMTQNQVVVSMLVLQYVLPVIIIIIGLVVWLRRRNK